MARSRTMGTPGGAGGAGQCGRDAWQKIFSYSDYLWYNYENQ